MNQKPLLTGIGIMPILLLSVFINVNAAIIPPSDPQFVSLTWTTRLSIQKDKGVQTWDASVNNPILNPTIYAVVNVNGVDTSGVDTFVNNSTVFQMTTGQTVRHIAVTHTFHANQIGETFIFQAQIFWGLSPNTINNVSNSTKSGTFTITP